MHNIRMNVVWFAALALVLPAAGTAADPARREPLSFTITEVSSSVEQVVDIDRAARNVTLQDEEGTLRTVKVGPKVRNLNRVNKGDTVTVESDTTINVEVQAGPGNTMNIGSETETGAAPGAKPSGMRIIEGKLKTVVEAIDHQARTITFKGRRGTRKTYTIGPEVKGFDAIRRGDMLVIEYKQTIAASVAVPEK